MKNLYTSLMPLGPGIPVQTMPDKRRRSKGKRPWQSSNVDKLWSYYYCAYFRVSLQWVYRWHGVSYVTRCDRRFVLLQDEIYRSITGFSLSLSVWRRPFRWEPKLTAAGSSPCQLLLQQMEEMRVVTMMLRLCKFFMHYSASLAVPYRQFCHASWPL